MDQYALTERVHFQPVNAVLTHEVVVPRHLGRHHEEAKEAIRQQHLHPFIVRWQVTLGVVAFICVLPAPLISARGQLISSQCTRSWSKTTQERTIINQSLASLIRNLIIQMSALNSD